MANDNIKDKIGTKYPITWCPGCPNFMILEAVKKALLELISKDKIKQEDFAMTTDIGCNSKIFDYLNISGLYGLHGRAVPAAIGIKLGNPNLKVMAFQGDGGAYDEGISHFIHACRYNSDMTLFVHDNQSFSLTTGQATATSEQNFKSKAQPYGQKDKPLNPIKLALASGATFIARCNPMDIPHTKEIIKKAIKHKGFSFIELMQKCLIFNIEMNQLDKMMYKVEDNKDMKKAEQLADEWDYNTNKTGRDKIPIGILYESDKEATLEQKWPQLSKLLKQGKSWKQLKK
jgi:2-oxoglutarate ferredoxin oxidoreductase subunit beta